jgi:hypothetical protein
LAIWKRKHARLNFLSDLRAVVIPKAGVPHNHPAFVRTKTPFQVAKKYKKAAEIMGVIGQTTLRIDKGTSLQFYICFFGLDKYHFSGQHKRAS